MARFLEDEFIYRFGESKYILTDNGFEWSTKFDQLCISSWIRHQYIMSQWPRCNGMVKRIVKTLEHGLIVLSTTPEHAQDWDKHFPRIHFGYKGGV
jgi:hypothetical protein